MRFHSKKVVVEINILFMTIGRLKDIEQGSIYGDLLRIFRDNGHEIYTVCPALNGNSTEYVFKIGFNMLFVKNPNILAETNLFKKGIATISVERTFIKAIKKYLGNVKFDLIIYSTPPITFAKVIKFVKNRDKAKTYLLLKDIFPQNAVDLGIISKKGLKGLLYKYFRFKEKQLYRISDYIGCMSEANREYIKKNNHEIDDGKLEICPNSIIPLNMSVSAEERKEIRERYNLPTDKKIFVCGGNFGKPQGVPFMVDAVKKAAQNDNTYFLFAGNGTERYILENYINKEKPENIQLFERLPKAEFDKMITCCDAGFMFLDNRFTIPNFPSRLLTYMQAKLPVFACTDKNTDIGKVITDGGFGLWCESASADDFKVLIDKALDCDLVKMGETAYKYLKENYSADRSYQTIIEKMG